MWLPGPLKKQSTFPLMSIKIAIEGCCHGELDKIYDTIRQVEEHQQSKIDLLLICGDFQAIRCHEDLAAMSCPDKFKQLGTFYKYYTGEVKAPVLTIFIGGNHEASNYSQELPYGGWVAENIFYMGYADVVNFGGLRIAGLSGIFNGRDYHSGHYERAPYGPSELRSVYHMRQIEVFKMLQVQKPVDICLSHDWPRGITYYGNVDDLLQKKPFLAKEINENSLGNPPCEDVLHTLKPKYWFSAHLHVKFAALVTHEDGSTTKFLALDKCLPGRDFLQILDLPVAPDAKKVLQYDLEWLAILKTTNKFDSNQKSNITFPPYAEWPSYQATAEALEKINNTFNGNLEILPVHFPVDIGHDTQNTTFCQRLGLSQVVIPHDAPVGFAPLSFRTVQPPEPKEADAAFPSKEEPESAAPKRLREFPQAAAKPFLDLPPPKRPKVDMTGDSYATSDSVAPKPASSGLGLSLPPPKATHLQEAVEQAKSLFAIGGPSGMDKDDDFFDAPPPVAAKKDPNEIELGDFF